ncbi:MAG: hydrolase [Thermoanaerobaculia bacterium]|nr:hydrolase [Thermoanaerobaculia bacterium]
MSRRIDRNDALLLVIDVQEKLMPHIHDHESVEKNIIRMIRGTHVLGVPVIVTEQYPEGIGHTIESVTAALAETHGTDVIRKMTFSSCGSDEFTDQVASRGRRDLILAGIEAHVCVFQTAIDLLDQEFRVWIVADAVSSRTPSNRQVALDRLSSEGVRLSSTEMILFELTVACGTDEFRSISKLVK